MAAGRQVPRAAPGVRQQDGQDRRRLPDGARLHGRPAGRERRGGPVADGRRGPVPRARRPGRDEGLHLRRRSGYRDPGRGDPGRVRGHRRHQAQRADRAPGRRRRRRRHALPRRRRGAGRAAPRRDPQGHHLDEDLPGLRGLRPQEQGRAAAARRRHQLPAEPARRAPHARHRSEQRRAADPACRRSRRPRPRWPSRS